MKKHNFYAGPSILSEYTIKNTADAVLNFADTGLSLLEISHRSKEFTAVIEEAKTLVKELLEVPAGYDVLFLGGGASMQFCMVPYNLLNRKAAYLETGTWAVNAIKEAKLFGEVDVVASSKEANFSYIPKGYTIPDDVDYFHFTSNNTIYGTEMRFDPDVNVPLVADMSSDIFSRPIDVSKYNVIYAGAQKNLAPAGPKTGKDWQSPLRSGSDRTCRPPRSTGHPERRRDASPHWGSLLFGRTSDRPAHTHPR